MTEKKYIIEENVIGGDRFQQYFDSREEAEAAFDDTINHRTKRELENCEIILGMIERTPDYIDEDMINNDDWWIGYQGFTEIAKCDDGFQKIYYYSIDNGSRK